ncbi:hypothetical protein [Metaclostridioides mangenotii]|uniref:hypothetical protein n=1 Tax=Metaclostridioides mangenotii TaxID=1540 RepID=UPI0026F045E2|nr:hypothetical protein [Clostridioides mangenotii]
MRVKNGFHKVHMKLMKRHSNAFNIHNSNGYLLIEGVVSLSVVVVISLTLYSLLSISINLKNKMNDSLELQQQAVEITKHIESLFSNSKGIISVVPRTNSEGFKGRNVEESGVVKSEEVEEFKNGKIFDDSFVDTRSIQLKYSSEDNNIDDKQIYLNENRDKVFVTSVKNGASQPGGYEIGDYVDNMFIQNSTDDRYIKVLLKLSKNSQKYTTEFDINMLNFE